MDNLSNVAIRLHDELRALEAFNLAQDLCKAYFDEYADPKDCRTRLDESDFEWAIQWGLFNGDARTAREWCADYVAPWFADREEHYWELGY